MTLNETRRAAELLRLLANVELARLEDEFVTAGRLLDAVDPIECRLLADSLTFDASIRALHVRERVCEDVLSIRRPW